ncbi:hypothetical protein ACH5RR_031743 [Cinchona calisaya]|uniref:F-box domain-containing protein n=1 Tax=Cinchona calisaya TaxID=153742 RepID=A0ABD2YG52_9GENT
MDSQIAIPQDSDLLTLPDLPFELITDILLRLPVKSLLKFSCVSKTWLSLISSSKFIKSHLKLSSENKEYTHHKLMLFDMSYNSLKSCSLQSFLDAPMADDAVTNISPPVELPDKPFRHDPLCVVGSCDGLICLDIDYDLYLWNPSTRKYKKLPRTTIEEGPEIFFYMNCGFGYDKSSDNYKVVAIFEESPAKKYYIATQVWIYGLKTDSWRRIVNFRKEVHLEKSGKFLNGKLHWEVGSSVVSIDLETEMYEEFELSYCGKYRFDSALGKFEGKLAALCSDYKHIHLWVMKEYGVKESWTKIFTVSYRIDLWSNYCPPLLCRRKNGEIIVLQGWLLMVYNLKDDLDKDPQVNRFYGFIEANLYVESLINPLVMMD